MSVPILRELLLAVALLAGMAGRQDPPPELPAAEASTAQEQQSGDPQASGAEAAPSDSPEPRPIPEGEILARAEVVSGTLRRVEARIEPEPAVERIAEQLGRTDLDILLARGELESLTLEQVTARRLEDLRLPWLELVADLAGWKARVSERFEELQDKRESLRAEREAWELTRARAADQELSDELLGAVDATLERLVEIESRVRERRDQVGSILQRVVTSDELATDAIDRLDELDGLLRKRRLRRGAPLWQAFAAEAPGAPAPGPLRGSGEWTEALVDYAELAPGRLLVLAAVFLLLLWGALALRRRRPDPVAAGNEERELQELLGRSYSVALAGTLLLTVPLLPYPRGSASDALFLVSIVPMVRLGSVVLSGRLRGLLYRVVGLALLVRLAGLWVDESAGSRLLLLATTALGLGLAAFHARAGGGEPASRRGRVVRILATLAALPLAVALGANLLGWTELSRELTEAAVGSAFSALGWLVVVTALVRDFLPILIAGPVGQWLASLRRNDEAVTRVLGRLAALVAVLMWLRGTLVRFRLDGPFWTRAEELAASRLELGELVLSVGDLLAASVVLLGVWLLARLTRFVLREQVFPSLRLRRGSGESILTVSNYVIWGVGIALAASSAGLSGTHLAVVIGTLGLGIGFGLQTIVNNFVSGLILLFERPIKVGDTLQLPGCWGRVERIGIRASVIRSFDGAEIIVPNGDLISKEVINWTGTDETRRLEVPVGVAYGSDPERVMEILQRVAGEHEQVLRWPEASVEMIGFGESALEFRLRCWTRVDGWLRVSSDLHVAIVRELGRAGIAIPFPQRDLHLKSMPPGARPGVGAGDRTD